MSPNRIAAALLSLNLEIAVDFVFEPMIEKCWVSDVCIMMNG